MAFTEQEVQTLAQGAAPQPAAAEPTPLANGTTPIPAITPPTPAPTPSAATPGAAPAAAPDDPEYEYVDLDKLGFESMDQLQERLNRYTDLEREVNELNEYKKGPKFRSDRSKHLYDFADKFEGMELTAARQLLDVVSLDLNSLPPEQMRFEAFKLNPANQSLSQEEMYKLFVDEETLRFGNSHDVENPQTEAQKIRAKQATAQAKDQIAKMQNEWNATRTAAPPSPAEYAQQLRDHDHKVRTALTAFDGIQVKLQAKDDKGEKLEGALNYKLNSQNQKEAIIEAVRDPAGWWDRILENEGIFSEGNTDYVKFADLVTWIDHKDELLNKSYQQGREDHKADLLKTARNIADPNAATGTPPGAPAALDKASEVNRAAMKAAGII